MFIPVTNYKDRMLELRKRGWTLEKIGNKFGVTRERVRQIIGTKFKPPSLRLLLKDVKPLIFEMRKVHTYKEIGKIIGLSSKQIYNILGGDIRRLGIKYLKYPKGYLRCHGCSKVKPENDFSLQARKSKTGRRCRKCAKRDAIKYADLKARARLYQKHGKYYKQQKAHGALYYALKHGKIKKGKCFLKNKDCFGRIEAHHYLGYEKEHWLDVIWVCSQHHDILDRTPLEELFVSYPRVRSVYGLI